MVLKNCTNCKKAFEVNSENFYRDPHSKDGFRTQCKKCENEKRKLYYQKNKERFKEINKRYYANNKEKRINYFRKYTRGYREKKRDFLRFYNDIHRWVRNNKPKQIYCTICNKYTHKLELANISGKYKQDINDYLWLCRDCHVLFDEINKTHKDHEMLISRNRGVRS